MRRRRHALALALAIPFAIAPAVAGADLRTTFVSYVAGAVAPVRVSIGVDTPISFGPGEQITFAQIDDSVRWEAHEAPSLKTPDGAAVPRIGVVAAEAAQTYLTVRTVAGATERTYRLRLQAVPHAPATVAYVYGRTFISRAPTIAAADVSSSPATAAAVVATAHASPIAAATSAPAPAAAPHAAPASLTPAEIALGATSPATAAIAGNPFVVTGPTPVVNPCPNEGKVSNSLRTLTYATQAADAALVVKALRARSFAHAVFGVHSLAWYLGELAIQDYAVHRLMRKACPNEQNMVNAALGAAALYNAASIPTAVHP